MMETFHPMGNPELPGRSRKYWIVSERHGRLGGLSFHAASWHERARDRHIGWSGRARLGRLHEVVNNSRFLILPGVRVHGLASQALRAACGRLPEDWIQAYGDALQMVYTYVDPSHSGYSYHCAGWRHIGRTSGRMNAQGRAMHVYALGLSEGWRERLCREPRQRFHPATEPYLDDEAHWTDCEYGRSMHPDRRVSGRILLMGKAWERRPGQPTPVRFPDEAARKGACRLLSNKKVSMDDILESHRQSTVDRCARHGVVLAVQDTTGLNYDARKRQTRGLTPIGGTARGVYAHLHVAFSTGGQALGVLDIDGDFRSRCAKGGPELKESIRWIEGVDTAAELSAACGGGTRVISVADREGDIWEYYERQQALSDRVGCLVRVNNSRQRKVLAEDGTRVKLREHVESLPALATRTIEIEAQGGKRARSRRTATLQIRCARVHVMAPGNARKSIPLIAVSAREKGRSKSARGRQPLNWLLLCSEGEADARHAVQICQWYEARWSIEEYIRTLKTGCRSQERQFDDRQDLLKCLAFDAIAAWRVLSLQRLAKYQPCRLATECIDPDRIRVLRVLLHHQNRKFTIRPPPDLGIRQYVIDLARLAGFSPTAKQPLPGTRKLWQAETQLMMGVHTFEAMNAMNLIDQDVWSSVSK